MALTPYEVATPYEGHTLAAEHIANTVIKEEEAKIAAAPKEALSGQTAELIAPDGKLFQFPVENLSAAMKAGFRAERPEETAAREYIKEHPAAAAWGARAKGLVSSGTLGIVGDKQLEWLGKNLPSWLGGGLTEDEVKRMTEIWKKKHGDVLVGDVAGMLLTLPLASGVAGVGAKAAIGADALIARGGASALAGQAYRGAVEGMAVAGGKAVREYVEGNPGMAAETIAWGAVPGAVLGGGLQLARTGLGAPSAAGESTFASKAWFRSAGSNAGKKALIQASNGIKGAEEAARFVNEEMPVFRRALTESHVDYERRIEPWVNALMEKPLPRSPEEAQLLARQFAEELQVDAKTAAGLVDAKKALGESQGEFYALMDTALNKAITSTSGEEKILGKIMDARRIKGPLAPGEEALKSKALTGFDTDRLLLRVEHAMREEASNPFLKPIWDSIKNGELERLDALAKEVTGDSAATGKELAELFAGHTGEEVSFTKAWKWLRGLDSMIFRGSKAASPRVEELQKIRGIFRNEIQAQAGEITSVLGKYDERFARALPELQAANKAYSKVTAWLEGAAAEAKSEASHRHFGPSDQSWAFGASLFGAISGSPMPLVYGLAGGIAHRFIRRNFWGVAGRVASGMPSMELGLASMGKEMMLMPQALEAALPGARAAHKIIPAEVFSQWMPKKTDDKPSSGSLTSEAPGAKDSDPVKTYLSFANEIARLATDPAALQARIKPLVDALMQESPAVAMATAQHYAAMIAHINQIMPKPSRQITPLSEKVQPYVSKAEMDKFAQRLALIDNPMLARDFLATRTLTREHMETLFKVWPQTYNAMVMAIQEHAASGKAKALDWRGNVQTSLMLGVATVPQMKGKAIAGIQQVYVAEQMGGAPGIQSGGKPTNVKGPDVLTEAQRLSSGRKR